MRDVLQSMEVQLCTKCSEVRDLQEQNHTLTQDLDEARNQNLQLHLQVSEILCLTSKGFICLFFMKRFLFVQCLIMLEKRLKKLGMRKQKR